MSAARRDFSPESGPRQEDAGRGETDWRRDEAGQVEDGKQEPI